MTIRPIINLKNSKRLLRFAMIIFVIAVVLGVMGHTALYWIFLGATFTVLVPANIISIKVNNRIKKYDTSS